MSIFYIGLILLDNNHTTHHIAKSIIAGIIGGAIGGVLFGWVIGAFSKSRFVSATTKISTEPDEIVLFETPANHFKGIEAVGGKLYLTNKRVIFKSHKLNIQNHELSIKLGDISCVERYKTLGVVNNGLSIMTSQNSIEKFVVEQVEEWVRQLTSRLEKKVA